MARAIRADGTDVVLKVGVPNPELLTEIAALRLYDGHGIVRLIHRWAAGMERLRGHFGGGAGPLPVRLVETAESLFAELLASMDEPVLLHGDLHHWNILSAEREPWLALDPKGVVGEPAYEVGALLRNPLPGLLDTPNPGRILARRVDQLAEELGFDRQRLIGWGVAQAVLSAWWSIEDHGEHREGWKEAMTCAELLAERL